MAYDFPVSPAENQEYTPVGAGHTYVYKTPRWTTKGTSADWNNMINKPATFPPTLPIPQSGVTNLIADLGLKAPIDNPVFTGNARAVTQIATDNDTSIATTAFVNAAIALGITGKADILYVDNQDELKANVESPIFSGDPQAPTPIAGNNSKSIATTAFVRAAIGAAGSVVPGSILPHMDGTAAVGTALPYSREDHRHPSDTSRAPTVHTHAQSDITGLATTLALKAPLASPVFTGIVTLPSAVNSATATSSISINGGTGTGAGRILLFGESNASYYGRIYYDATQHIFRNEDGTSTNQMTFVPSTGTLTVAGLTADDATLTGVPTVATAAAGTNTAQIASTAFVTAGLALKANTSSLGSYLPLTGGTLTGNIMIDKASPVLYFQKSLDTETTYISWRRADGKTAWNIGHMGTDNNLNVRRYDSAGAYANTAFSINWATGVTSGTFAGNGAGLTSVDAETLDGYNTAFTGTANTIAVRDVSGDIYVRLIRSEYATTSGSCAYFMGQQAVGAGSADNYIRPMTIAQAAAQLDSALVPVGRTVTAGNGLSGGGALSANQVISMDLPGTLSGTTTNAVSSSSHTHDLDLYYTGSTATNSNFPVGQYVWVKGGSTTPTANAAVTVYIGTDIYTQTDTGTLLAGTWRCRGGVSDRFLAQRTA